MVGNFLPDTKEKHGHFITSVNAYQMTYIIPDAKVDHVHDGDTPILYGDIPVWYEISAHVSPVRMRLAKLYCAELKNSDGTDNADGLRAKAELDRILKLYAPIRVEALGYRDNYGRPLVNLYVVIKKQEVLVNKMMVDNGFGRAVTIRQQLVHPIFSKPLFQTS
jgi:endonuclease YncB( thermonuclease family)